MTQNNEPIEDYELDETPEVVDEELAEESEQDVIQDEDEDDDLAVLASSDEVVASADAMAAVTQGDDFMLWNIEGLYNEETNRPYRSRFLKQNPPILHIENRRDDETYFADFVLTREVARTLEQGLRTTNRAYSGVTDSKPLSKEGMKRRSEELLDWAKEHIVAVSVLGIAILFLIIFGFIL